MVERIAAGLLIAVGNPGPAVAAEALPAGASPYRLTALPQGLRLTESASYRLDKRYLRAAEPEPEPEPAPALADKPFSREIDVAAREAALDPALVHAVIFVESRYRQAAVSPKGAIGLMQVLPDTALRYGVTNPGRSVEANLKAGTRYLRDLIAQFDNRLELALAAYNAGEGAVLRYANRIPPYPETQAYVPAVMARYEEWRSRPRLPARNQYLPGTLLKLRSAPAVELADKVDAAFQAP